MMSLRSALFSQITSKFEVLTGPAWASSAPAPALRSHHPLGALPDFRRDALAVLARARAEAGPISRMRLGPVWFHLVSDPAVVHRILVEDQKLYSKQTRGYDALRRGLGDGLVTSEGELWRTQRRIIQPAFHKKSIGQMADVIAACGNEVSERWQGLARQGQTFDLASEMMGLSLKIAGRALFGVDLTSFSGKVGAAMNTMMETFERMTLSFVPFIHHLPTRTRRRADSAIAEIDGLVQRIIAERRAKPSEGGDMVQMLLDAQDPDTGQGMSNSQLRDEMVTMLTAGHETTANALTFSLYLLAKHPDIARRVQNEAKQLLAEGPIDIESYGKLVFTRQVLSEAMRLLPPVWLIGRRAISEVQLGPYLAPARSVVFISPWLLHRDPALWRNPEIFDPDRWAPGAPPPSKGSYIPFSLGPRKCVGDHFAQLSAVLSLAILSAHFRLTLPPGFQLRTLPSVTLRPRGIVPVTLTALKVPQA